MSLARQVAFARRFSRGYDRLLADGTPFKESARVQHVRGLCREYNKHLKAMGMRDYQVALVPTAPCAPPPAPCPLPRAHSPPPQLVEHDAMHDHQVDVPPGSRRTW